MKSLTESPAVLTVHQGSPGQFVIRGERTLIVGVTKMLAERGAKSFVVITPTDVKVFAVSENGDAVSAVDDGAAGNDPVDGAEAPIDQETQAAIDAEESREIPSSPQLEVVPRVVKRDRNKNKSIVGKEVSCGRCNGEGKIATLLDGGQAASVSCPVCKGSGVSKQVGRR